MICILLGENQKVMLITFLKKSGYQEIKIIPKLFTKSKIISEFFTIVLGVLRVFFLPSNIIIAQNFPPRQYGEAVVIRYFNKIKK